MRSRFDFLPSLALRSDTTTQRPASRADVWVSIAIRFGSCASLSLSPLPGILGFSLFFLLLSELSSFLRRWCLGRAIPSKKKSPPPKSQEVGRLTTEQEGKQEETTQKRGESCLCRRGCAPKRSPSRGHQALLTIWSHCATPTASSFGSLTSFAPCPCAFWEALPVSQYDIHTLCPHAHSTRRSTVLYSTAFQLQASWDRTKSARVAKLRHKVPYSGTVGASISRCGS